jgi:hypothetical protein
VSAQQRRRPTFVELATARPRLTAAFGALVATALVVTGAGAAGLLDADIVTSDARELDAARVAPPSSTSSTAAPTTTSTSTTSTTVPPATEPPTTPSPTTAAPPPTTIALPPPPPPPPPLPAAPAGTRCLVRLHGKGGNGAGTSQSGDVTVLSPPGNASGWGGRQWLYFAPGSYEAAFGSIAHAVDASGCGQVIVDGFSNGGAMAVKLYCRGESFGGRLVGVVADDPVPDHGADGCAPAPGVALTIYWTGALDAAAHPGWDCAEQDWTCEGGTTVGIGAYASNAGASPKRSPYSSHQWYTGAPELGAWR